MNKYIKPSLEEFINQYSTEKFQKYWDGNNKEFWKLVATSYLPVNEEKTEEQEDDKTRVMNYIVQNFKKIKVTANRKHEGDIYILITGLSRIVEYVCNLISKTKEEMERDPNFNLKVTIECFYPWAAADKSGISMKYGDKAGAKKAKQTRVSPKEALTEVVYPREELEEEVWAQRFAEDFGELDLQEGETWADMYEMFYVSKNPTEILETTGAIVKALARKKDGKNLDHHGYVRRIVYKKERAIELEIRTFKGVDEIWIWNGAPKTGSWLNKKEFADVKEDGKTARALPYRNLVVETEPFDLVFE